MTQNIPNISELESRSGVTVDLGKLDAETGQQLARAYSQMYYGMAWNNWVRPGTTLGRAWQSALTQIDAVVSKYPADNPAAAYLARVNKAHQRTWPKTIMTNPRRDGKLVQNGRGTAELAAYGNRQIESAQATIAAIIARMNVKNKSASQATEQKPMQKPAAKPIAAQPTQKPTVTQPVAAKPTVAQKPIQATQPTATPTAAVSPLPDKKMPAMRPTRPIVNRDARPAASAKPNTTKFVRNANTAAPADANMARPSRPMPNPVARPTRFVDKPLNTNPVNQAGPIVTVNEPTPKPVAKPIVKRVENRAAIFINAKSRLIQMQRLQIMMEQSYQHAA